MSDPSINNSTISRINNLRQGDWSEDEKEFYPSDDYDGQWPKDDYLVDQLDTIPYDWSDNEYDDVRSREYDKNKQTDDKNKRANDNHKTKLLFCLDIFFHKMKHEIKINNLDKKLMWMINKRFEHESLSEKKDGNNIYCNEKLQQDLTSLSDDPDELFFNLWHEHLQDYMIKNNLAPKDIEDIYTLSQNDRQMFNSVIKRMHKYIKKYRYRALLNEKQNNKFLIVPTMTENETNQILDKIKEYNLLNDELQGDIEISDDEGDEKNIFESILSEDQTLIDPTINDAMIAKQLALASELPSEEEYHPNDIPLAYEKLYQNEKSIEDIEDIEDTKAQYFKKGAMYKTWDFSKKSRPTTIFATEQQCRIYNKVLEDRAKQKKKKIITFKK